MATVQNTDYGINLRDKGLCNLVYRHKIWHRCVTESCVSISLGPQSQWSLMMAYWSVNYGQWSVLQMMKSLTLRSYQNDMYNLFVV